MKIKGPWGEIIKSEHGSKPPFIYAFGYFAALVLLSVFFIVLLAFKNVTNNYSDVLKLEPAIIIIPLPMTFTIVSLSLSLSKDKTYGITLNELNLLRGPFYFDFLHVVLIMCGIFAFYTLLYAFNVIIIFYVLTAVSCIYSLIFLGQQIPLLIERGNALKKIVVTQYKKVKAREDLFKAKREENIYIKLVQGILFVDNIEMAYELLENSNDDRNVLAHLLQMQYAYLIRFQTGPPSGYIPKPAQDGGFFVYETIDKGYHNILCQMSEDKDLGGYHLIRTSLFCLHSICQQTRMQSKEKEETNTLVSLFLLTYSLESGRQKGIRTVFATMCAYAIQRGETWLLEFLRDSNLYPIYMFRFGECTFGFFVSMMIAHALNSSFLRNEGKERLIAFTKNHFNGINSNRQSWCSMIGYNLQDCDPADVIKSPVELLGNMKDIDDEDLLFLGSARTVEYNPDSDYFNDAAIIGYWFKMNLYASSCRSGDCGFKESFNHLSEGHQKALLDFIAIRWLGHERQKSDAALPFLNAFVKTPGANLINKLYSNDLFASLVSLCEDK